MFPTATEPKTSGRRSGDPSSWPAERPTDRLLGPATIRTSITRLTLANECPTPTDGVGAMAELTPQCLASSVSDSCQISTANADQRWPDADARMAALWRLTIPDPVRPPFDRICKLGVAGSSPARSILEAPAHAGFRRLRGKRSEGRGRKMAAATRATSYGWPTSNSSPGSRSADGGVERVRRAPYDRRRALAADRPRAAEGDLRAASGRLTETWPTPIGRLAHRPR